MVAYRYHCKCLYSYPCIGYLLESVEFRHADFALWINDLSAPDPYFVLPVLTGLSMFFLQKMQPMAIQDPMQVKIMQFMPDCGEHDSLFGSHLVCTILDSSEHDNADSS